jgi:NAD(P)H-dependent FMN reductase
MKYLIISCSLHPRSLSRVLARRLETYMPAAETDFLDLAELPLPICDGSSAYSKDEVKVLAAKVEAAHGIIVASPIYNYDVSAAAKNVVELTGRAWSGKVVGLLCAAGGRTSYMAGMPFLNSLMLDFRSFVLPRFVYAPGLVFGKEQVIDEELDLRIQELAGELVRVTLALAAAPQNS